MSTPEVPRPAWHQVPRSPSSAGRPSWVRHRVAVELLAVAMAVLGPTVHAWTFLGERRGLLTAGVLAVGAAVMGRMPVDRYAVRLAIALVTAGGVMPFAGKTAGVWAATGLVLVDWAVRERPPLPRLPTGAEGGPPAVVLTLVAVRSGHLHQYGYQPLATSVLALVATAVALRLGARWTSAGKRFGRVVGEAFSVVAFTVLGLLVVVLPWLAHRLFWLDPVAVRARPGWNDRQRLDVRSAHPWTVDATERRLNRRTRLRWATAVPLTIALVAAASVLIQRATAPTIQRLTSRPPAAVGDASWWFDYQRELDWAFSRPGGATHPARFPPLLDIHSRYINVVHGRRVTWQPPQCSCRRLKVWVYGGSTALGWGQRDQHTPPSELARIAWRHGIALEVSNRAIAGDLDWQESERFAWDVAAEGAPDLVIFYDGSNDLRAASDVNSDRSKGYDPAWPIVWNVNDQQEKLDRNRFIQLFFGHRPSGAGRAKTTVMPELDAATLGRSVMRNYQRGRLPALGAAKQLHVPVLWFWQPDRYTRPQTAEEPTSGPDFDRFQRAERAAALAGLPTDVRDLSNMFDRTREPIYYDDVHTGEHGAHLVAARLYREIQPELAALLETPAVGHRAGS